ncbi:metacaspase-1 [Daucus carota subsp. sativus]|uniref:metacaspase-1 n=1 Tax=Daucus carota subsp. sativus TaxID=79200 RepID=UPI0007F02710|nr:PREDICTED: metacaspase-1-like [Daucus carota subsp. sativus]
MLMNASAICKHCNINISPTPHAQTLWCHGCGRIITVCRYQETWKQGKVVFETKFYKHSLRQRFSEDNCQKSLITSTVKHMHSETISSWEAPRGKRALLCGVVYSKQKYRLKGTFNDVNNMRHMLVEHFKFPSSSIHILTEGGPYFHPTKRNIQAGLKWLVKDCKAGDSLVFYFSGHGLRQPDFDNDELDGFDETICPLDFKTAGVILDNEINDTIVRPLKPGVRLHAIVDSCHSGTILDLSYVYNLKDKTWMNNHPPSNAYKGTSGGQAICFSACEDDQLAEDTSAFSGKQMSGAMTYTFIKAILENPDITYEGIMISMRTAIRQARATGCLLKRLFRRNILQEPLLSASEKFDTNATFNL